MTSPTNRKPSAAKSHGTASDIQTSPTLRERAEDAVESARERAIDAYDQAREGASKAKAKAGQQLGEAPLIALAGGLAAGAVLAALLPKSSRSFSARSVRACRTRAAARSRRRRKPAAPSSANST